MLIQDAVDWTVERARKGVEFEIEGGMVKLAAERAPAACATALGCSVMQGQLLLAGGLVLVTVVVVVLIRRRHKDAPHVEPLHPWDVEL